MLSDPYKLYAHIYDTLKHDRSADVSQIRELIQKHNCRAQQVLEIACGTAAILEVLSEDFSVTGLDRSIYMLRLARSKLPKARLVQADMVSFRLNQKFDVVYCWHNSVNHLLSFRAWVRMFDSVSQHLEQGGLFIFDINPPDRMEKLSRLPKSRLPAGEHYIDSQVHARRTRPGRYYWQIEAYMKRPKGSYQKRRFTVEAASFSVGEVLVALEQNFEIVDVIEADEERRPDEAGKVYIVCRRQAK